MDILPYELDHAIFKYIKKVRFYLRISKLMKIIGKFDKFKKTILIINPKNKVIPSKFRHKIMLSDSLTKIIKRETIYCGDFTKNVPELSELFVSSDFLFVLYYYTKNFTKLFILGIRYLDNILTLESLSSLNLPSLRHLLIKDSCKGNSKQWINIEVNDIHHSVSERHVQSIYCRALMKFLSQLSRLVIDSPLYHHLFNDQLIKMDKLHHLSIHGIKHLREPYYLSHKYLPPNLKYLSHDGCIDMSSVNISKLKFVHKFTQHYSTTLITLKNITHLKLHSLQKDTLMESTIKNLIYLYVDSVYSNLSKNITLPKSLKYLVIGNNVNGDIDELPDNLLALSVANNYKYEISYLPVSLKYVKISIAYIDLIPITCDRIILTSNVNVRKRARDFD